MQIDILTSLYKSLTGEEPTVITPLAAEGSNRRYFRLSGGAPLIGVVGTNLTENRAFIGLDRHFSQKGLPVPKVLAVSQDQMVYLQEDLGDMSLFRAIISGRLNGTFSPEEVALLEHTIRELPRFQYEGAEGLDFSLCFPVEAFDRRSLFWDLNYFKYCFLKATGVEFSEPELEAEFNKLADTLMGSFERQGRTTFMIRDFQSRNVMLTADGKPWFIDFQGGRRGPGAYDVASFLWQAKANIPADLREYLIDCYIDEASKYSAGISSDGGVRFHNDLRHFALFRILQTLGAYGFRGEFERKAHFIESIPKALANALHLLQEMPDEYPHLLATLGKAATLERYQPEPEREGLTVRVVSFSYKKGIPFDQSGNGGGFVFDCRSIHNPGRYEEYKRLTGRDKPVIDFLVENGDAAKFLKNVFPLVDTAVERYLKRGFTNLMACFGCTGGQHRSVYCAEALAHHLAANYPVNVLLDHREQNLSFEILPNTSPER